MGIPTLSIMEHVLTTHSTRQHRANYLNVIEEATVYQHQKGNPTEEDTMLWYKFKLNFNSHATWQLKRDERPKMEWYKPFDFRTTPQNTRSWLGLQ